MLSVTPRIRLRCRDQVRVTNAEIDDGRNGGRCVRRHPQIRETLNCEILSYTINTIQTHHGRKARLSHSPSLNGS
jgi:hypothetical protein